MANGRRDAVIYMLSSESVRSQRADFARQERRIRAYARDHAFDIVTEFRDACIASAAGLKQRQYLAVLLDYVEQRNRGGTVLVEKAARLACDPILTEVILAQFRRRYVDVIAVDSGLELTLDDSDPSCALTRKILDVITKFGECMLPLKLKAARQRVRREKGYCEGPKPFGSCASERETLNRILTLRRQARGKKRLGYYRIATILNKEGHQTRSGCPWIGPTVRGIIHRYERKQ